jgi:hypothetical protein
MTIILGQKKKKQQQQGLILCPSVQPTVLFCVQLLLSRFSLSYAECVAAFGVATLQSFEISTYGLAKRESQRYTLLSAHASACREHLWKENSAF